MIDGHQLIAARIADVGRVGDEVEADVALHAEAPVVDDGRRERVDPSHVARRRRQWTRQQLADRRVVGPVGVEHRRQLDEIEDDVVGCSGRRRRRRRRGWRSCRRRSRPRRIRGAARSRNGELSCGVPSYTCMPLMKFPESGTSRPMYTAGRISPVSGLQRAAALRRRDRLIQPRRLRAGSTRRARTPRPGRPHSASASCSRSGCRHRA